MVPNLLRFLWGDYLIRPKECFISMSAVEIIWPLVLRVLIWNSKILKFGIEFRMIFCSQFGSLVCPTPGLTPSTLFEPAQWILDNPPLVRSSFAKLLSKRLFQRGSRENFSHQIRFLVFLVIRSRVPWKANFVISVHKQSITHRPASGWQLLLWFLAKRFTTRLHVHGAHFEAFWSKIKN